MNTKANDHNLLSDINKIKELLGSRCKNIAVFGSTVKEGLERAADIDIAIFMDTPSTEYIVDRLHNIEFNFSFNKRNVSFSYGGGGINLLNNKKEFDIVVLDSKAPDSKFMSLNNASLKYIN